MTESANHKIGTKGINSHHAINRFFLSHGRLTTHKFVALTLTRNANIVREDVGKRTFKPSGCAIAAHSKLEPSSKFEKSTAKTSHRAEAVALLA